MPLIQALHGLTKSTKNNATSRVYPYGVVFNTILHSIIIHSIGVNMKPQNLPQDFDSFGQALKEAERLKQQNIYHVKNHNYMVVKTEKGYLIDLFSWIGRDEALKTDSLLIVI